MSGSDFRTPWDPETEYRIVESESPVSVDGYALGEPKRLECCACGASVLLTAIPSGGVDGLSHHPDCPQRDVRSAWWRGQYD